MFSVEILKSKLHRKTVLGQTQESQTSEWTLNLTLHFPGTVEITKFSGIQRDKTMDDKLMYIPNDDKLITPSVDKIVYILLVLKQPIKFLKKSTQSF